MYLTHLFQVRRNWLTWNTYRPQRALKQGLVFQVNVRNASIHIRLFATGKKWPFCSRCAQNVDVRSVTTKICQFSNGDFMLHNSPSFL